MSDVGLRFVRALAAKNDDELAAVFAPEVAFLGMTPRRFWEATNPRDVVAEVFHRWFEPADVIEELLDVADGSVADRRRVDYRFRVRNDDGVFLVEQRAYFDLDDAGLIARMNLTCAGFRPFEATPA